MLLRHLGAEIIKIEAPDIGDDSRHFEPFIDAAGQRSAYFASLNWGKKSVALDLGTGEGKQVLRDLIARSDVLVENFRPGAMARLGFPAEEIARINPRMVFASISGFGQAGPGSQRPAYDITVQALSGLMSITGTEDGAPVKVGASISDIVSGIYTALGIVSALYGRERSGVGSRLDVAMLDSSVSILENAIARYQATGKSPRPLGTRHASITPFDAFETQDSPIVIAAGNDRLFASLCAALGKPEWATDPRFCGNSARTQNCAALKEHMNTVLRTAPSDHWVRELEARGIPCAKIRGVAEVMADPLLATAR
jgi:CoA:oxalate CoA-transferase